MFPVRLRCTVAGQFWPWLVLAVLSMVCFSDASGAVRVNPEVTFGVSYIPDSRFFPYSQVGVAGSVGLPTRLWRAVDVLPQIVLRRHLLDCDDCTTWDYPPETVSGGARLSYVATIGLRVRLGPYQFAQIGVGTTQTHYEEFTLRSSEGTSRKVNWGTTPGDFVVESGVGFNIQATKGGTVLLVAGVAWQSEDYESITLYSLRTGFRFD
jgi:hypothetical protein